MRWKSGTIFLRIKCSWICSKWGNEWWRKSVRVIYGWRWQVHVVGSMCLSERVFSQEFIRDFFFGQKWRRNSYRTMTRPSCKYFRKTRCKTSIIIIAVVFFVVVVFLCVVDAVCLLVLRRTYRAECAQYLINAIKFWSKIFLEKKQLRTAFKGNTFQKLSSMKTNSP